MNEKTITKPLRTTVNGRVWRMFTADYKADQGTYSLEFYAISMEHAASIVGDIRETLELRGELIGTEEA